MSEPLRRGPLGIHCRSRPDGDLSPRRDTAHHRQAASAQGRRRSSSNTCRWRPSSRARIRLPRSPSSASFDVHRVRRCTARKEARSTWSPRQLARGTCGAKSVWPHESLAKALVRGPGTSDQASGPLRRPSRRCDVCTTRPRPSCTRRKARASCLVASTRARRTRSPRLVRPGR